MAKGNRALASGLCTLLCLTLASFSEAGTEPQPLATTQWSADQITWIAGDGSELLLTVTGPDFRLRRRGSGTLAFRPDAQAEALSDGSYRFELREVSPTTAADETHRRPRKLTARFRVVGGTILVSAKISSDVDSPKGGQR